MILVGIIRLANRCFLQLFLHNYVQASVTFTVHLLLGHILFNGTAHIYSWSSAALLNILLITYIHTYLILFSACSVVWT